MSNNIKLFSSDVSLTSNGHVKFDYEYITPEKFMDAVNESCPEYRDAILIKSILSTIIEINKEIDESVKRLINRW